jgi:hypothetical protein
VLGDVARVEGLQVAVAGGVKQDGDGHGLAQGERRGLAAAESAARQQSPPPGGFKEQAEVVDVTERR